MKILISFHNLLFSQNPRGIQRVATQLAYALNKRTDVDIEVSFYWQASNAMLYGLVVSFDNVVENFHNWPPTTSSYEYKFKILRKISKKLEKLRFMKHLLTILGRCFCLNYCKKLFKTIKKNIDINPLTIKRTFPSAQWKEVDLYDVLLSFEYAENLWEQPWCLKRKIKLVLIIHDIIFGHIAQSESNYLYRHLNVLESVVRRSDGLICNSQTTLEDLKNFFPEKLPPVSVALLASTTDISHFRFQNREQSTIMKSPIDSSCYNILVLGDIDRRKNFIAALKALPLLSELLDDRKIFLHVIGNMVNMDPIDTCLQKTQKVANVLFYGYLSDDEITKFYQEVDVLLFPSLYEGFGIPILEAFAQGTPVVTSCVSSMPEVSGDLGILVDPCNPRDIARGLLKVAKMTKTDRSLFSEKAKKYALRFTWERTAEKVVEFMQNLLESEEIKYRS
ncbi:MAG: glycosyltransferase family 4 protein [Streptococcaceae bacterium]|jgi:glycosyltransferase involved in cell wall biosynthesis|nr:glycosyltransferase family 4 protein [Streptococcaceae bacterium]